MKLYAIRFGKNFKYGLRNTVLKGCERPNELFPDFDFLYYLAEYQGKNILFDVGFRDENLADQMGIKLLPIENEIGQLLGKNPMIHKIVLTHSHWDHVNNLDLYPEAKVIVAKETFDEILEQCSIEVVKNRLINGNVVLVDNEYVIEDKFHFCVVGGHSAGSSVIYFEEDGRTYVLTGDECYSLDNMLKNIPIGIYKDTEKNTSFIENAHLKGCIPLPCHDGRVMSQYEKLSENIVRII